MPLPLLPPNQPLAPRRARTRQRRTLQSVIGRALLSFFLAIGLVLGSATVAQAEPPQAIPQNASDGDLKWQPGLDYDGDSCYSTPAISADGVPAEGLSLEGSRTENCRAPADLDNTNAYVRTWCQGEWCAHKYAYYFEKDQTTDGLSAGHRHDLEHIVIWVQADQVRYVAVSGHGSYDIRDADDVRFEGTHAKVVYHKDGGATHAFRFAAEEDDPPENHEHTWQRPALVGWERMDPAVRDVFANHGYGSATLALKDSTYADDLRKAKKVDPPWDFDAPLPSTDPPPDTEEPPVKDRDVFLKLMPLGDSITDGVGSSKGYGYRQPMRNKLVAGGSTVDLVGFNRSGDMDDPDHEGHSGSRIEQIFEKARSGIESFKPNVITLMAGTNDLGQQYAVAEAPQRLATMIQQIRTLDDGVVIAVATIADSKDGGLQSRIDAYNAAVARYVSSLPEDHHVILADMNAVTVSDMADSLHPNDSGYEKIATSFTRAVNRAIDKGWVGERDPGETGGGATGVASGAVGPVNWYPQGRVAHGVGAKGDDVRLADLNGDGRDDYVAVAENGSARAWLNGLGTPDNWTWHQQETIAHGVGAPGSQVRFADINGDGRDDYLVVADNGAVRAWLNGNGVPNNWNWYQQETIAHGVGAPGSDVRFADINADGFDDYLVVGDNGALSEIWLNGNGVPNNWTWHQRGGRGSGVGAPTDQVRFADLNSDRRADYFVVEPDSGAMRAWAN